MPAGPTETGEREGALKSAMAGMGIGDLFDHNRQESPSDSLSEPGQLVYLEPAYWRYHCTSDGLELP